MTFPPNMNDDLNLKMKLTSVKSLESTRRMLTLCEESTEAGIKTLVMLDDQGEQLERIEGALDAINEDTNEAEGYLKEMEKCCGLCVLPSRKRAGKYANTWKNDDDNNRGVVSDQPRISAGDPFANSAGGCITKITNDAREEEMEENMQQVSSMIGNLRHMAVDICTEVTNQNRQLERINDKATSNQERLKEANQRATKIISKA